MGRVRRGIGLKNNTTESRKKILAKSILSKGDALNFHGLQRGNKKKQTSPKAKTAESALNRRYDAGTYSTSA